jgi:hypothetical protein
MDYKENVIRGNLLICGKRTFCSLALAGHLQTFEELRVSIEDVIEAKTK